MNANDRQVGGVHYKDRSGRCPACGEKINHWDLYSREEYLPAQIAKYTLRYRDKGGLQDLQKAKHFLEKLIEVVQAEEDHALHEEPHLGAVSGPPDDPEGGEGFLAEEDDVYNAVADRAIRNRL